jgi:hypothetical protein
LNGKRESAGSLRARSYADGKRKTRRTSRVQNESTQRAEEN